jgi:hypothetical protein
VRPENGGEIILSHEAQVFCGLFYRQVGDQDSVDAGVARDFAEFFQAHSKDGIQVRKNNQSGGLRMHANLRRQLQDPGERGTVFEGSLDGALDHGAVGDRFAEGNAKFDDIGSGGDGGKDDFARGCEIGIAAGDERDQGRLIGEGQRHRIDFRSLISDFSLNCRDLRSRSAIGNSVRIFHKIYNLTLSIDLQVLSQNSNVLVAATGNIHDHDL